MKTLPKTKSTRGGARPNSGRKPGPPKVSKLYRLPKHSLDEVRLLQDKWQCSASEAVEKSIAKASKRFKQALV